MDFTKLTSQELTARIMALRMAASQDYANCKRLAFPMLEELNNRQKEIAKKYNKKPHKFTFAGFGRNLS